MKGNMKYIGGIKVRDWKGLQRYLNAALKRCECSLDDDRKSEIEEFLLQEYWLKGKPIPTKIVVRGKTIQDPAVRWALREKLRDIHFQNHTVSTVQNDDGEEIDVFECIGEKDNRYKEIEQWHDICCTIGAEPAKALLFGLYEAETEEKEAAEKERQKWESRQGVLF